MNSNNIVQFPKEYNGPLINGISIEEINENVNMVKYYHIQETIENLVPIIFNTLEVSGFDVIYDEDDISNISDGALIVESIRAILCRHYGIFHPFQVIAENVFEEDDEGAGSLKIKDSLNIDMKEKDSE
jgi:hypothetical protein